MKILIIFFIFTATFLKAQNFVDIYREKGIGKIEKLFEQKLQSTKYWKEYLKDINTTYGYFETDSYLIAADKNSKKLKLFHITNGSLKTLFEKDVILGKKGEKKREGDLATPVGAYTIIDRFKPKDTYYGPLAFALSYPNLYDRLNGRDGHGIWIHGYPLDHEKRPSVTKGCMVLKNRQLLKLASLIDEKNTSVLIFENGFKKTSKEQISKLLAFLYRWRNAWKTSDIDRYLSCYADDFIRYDGKDLTQFSNYKKAIFAKKEKKSIVFKNITILPYPNLKNISLFKINFYEIYRTKNYNFRGQKEIYVRLGNSGIKIVVEK